MKNNNSESPQTPTGLLNDLHSLVNEAEAVADDSLTERTEDAVTSLRARFDAAQERLTELYSGARKKVVAGAIRSMDTRRSRP